MDFCNKNRYENNLIFFLIWDAWLSTWTTPDGQWKVLILIFFLDFHNWTYLDDLFWQNYFFECNWLCFLASIYLKLKCVNQVFNNKISKELFHFHNSKKMLVCNQKVLISLLISDYNWDNFDSLLIHVLWYSKICF